MYKKLLNIKENLDQDLRGSLADTRTMRNYLMLIQESKMTGTRKVIASIKISDYKHPGIALGVIKRKYHDLLDNINQDRYRLFPLDILDEQELQLEGLDSADLPDMMQAVPG